MINKVWLSVPKQFHWMKKDDGTLVMLIPGFPESETDSTCLPMQQAFALSLKRLYPQLEIIVLSFQYPYHTEKYTWFDIQVIPFSGRNKGWIKKLLLRKKIKTVLKEIHSTRTITGLLSFWCAECAMVGKSFADKYDIKHLCWISGQDARKKNYYVKKIEPRATELVALSDFLQQEFERNHSIRPEYIVPSGIDLNSLAEKDLRKDIDILGAGSLIPLKQYNIFLELIYEIKKTLPSIKVLLCGKGPEENNLKTQLNKLGLQNNVTLTGELPNTELVRLMRRSKLLLHTSSYEGLSGVCLEALHAGAHVISFCKAMDHSIENWHIVKDKEEMKQKALEILQNPAIEFKAVVPYTTDESAKKIMQLFTS